MKFMKKDNIKFKVLRSRHVFDKENVIEDDNDTTDNYQSIWNHEWNYKTILKWLHGIAILTHLFLAIVGTITYVTTPVVNAPITIQLVDYGAADGKIFYLFQNKSVIGEYPIFLGGLMVEWITMVFHCLYLFRILWENDVPQNGHWQRWLEYSITSTLMSFNAQLSIGMNDIYLLIVCLGHGIALQPLGYLMEQLPRGDDTNSKIMRQKFGRVFGFIGFMMNFPIVVLYIVHMFLSSHIPSSFKENIFFFSLYFNLFGLNASLFNDKKGQWKDFRWVECMYNVLSLTTKVAVFVIPFATYRALAESNHVTSTVGVNWDVVRYLLGDSIPIVTLVFFVIIFLPKK